MKYGNWIVEGDRFAMQTGVLGKVFLCPSAKIGGSKVDPTFWSKEMMAHLATSSTRLS